MRRARPRHAPLPVPEIVLVEVDPVLGRAEPDSEIRQLLEASAGLNAGLDFLPGALNLTPAGRGVVDPAFAADVVWFDALVTNVDRTPRNPNLLAWHGRTWLIDHGAALYWQHGEAALAAQARRPFPLIADHVLLGAAGSIRDSDARLAPLLDREVVEGIVAQVPVEWLAGDPEAARREYVSYLLRRLEPPRSFVEDAERARGA